MKQNDLRTMSAPGSGLRSFFTRPSARKYWIVGSLLLVVSGERLLHESKPVSVSNTLLDTAALWNEKLLLGLDNLINIILGFFLLTLGATLFNRSLSKLEWAQPTDKTTQSIPDTPAKIDWKRILPWLVINLTIYVSLMVQLAHHKYSAVIFWIWLGTLFIPTFLLWSNERKNGVSLKISITRVDGIWMFSLFALGIGIASFLLNDLRSGWFTDEVPFWSAARSIALGGLTPPFFDFGVYTFPIASSIFQGWVLRWAGLNLWGWRFSSVLPAVASIIPLYLLARELFDRRVAVAAGIMLAANPYFISFARLGYNNSQSLFPAALCVYFLVLGMKRNSLFFLWLAGMTAGLGFYTYYAAWIGLVVIVVVFIGHPIGGRHVSRKNLIPLLLVILGGFAMILPRILYGFGNALHYKIWEPSLVNTFYGKALFGEERIGQAATFLIDNQTGIFYDPALYVIMLLRGLILSTIVLFDPMNYQDQINIYGLAGPVSSIFLTLGLGWTIANMRKPRFFILSTWFWAGLILLGGLASFPPRPSHMISILPAMALISAVGLIFLLDALSLPTSLPGGTSTGKNILTGCILVAVTAAGLFQYFVIMPYKFAPGLNEYASWMGRQVTEPAKFVFIEQDPVPRAGLNEYTLKLSQHEVISISRADLETNPGQLKSWDNFVVFIDYAQGRGFADWLAEQVPDAHVHIAYAPIKRPRGYLVTNIPIDPVMQLSFSRGLHDLWISPARSIILACLAGILFLLVPVRKSPAGFTNTK